MVQINLYNAKLSYANKRQYWKANVYTLQYQDKMPQSNPSQKIERKKKAYKILAKKA